MKNGLIIGSLNGFLEEDFEIKELDRRLEMLMLKGISLGNNYGYGGCDSLCDGACDDYSGCDGVGCDDTGGGCDGVGCDGACDDLSCDGVS